MQQTDRRNAENAAEYIVGATQRALQRLLREAPCEPAPVIDRLQAYLSPRPRRPAGIFILDESGFPKQGTRPVGVAPQYCGVLGRLGELLRRSPSLPVPGGSPAAFVRGGGRVPGPIHGLRN